MECIPKNYTRNCGRYFMTPDIKFKLHRSIRRVNPQNMYCSAIVPLPKLSVSEWDDLPLESKNLVSSRFLERSFQNQEYDINFPLYFHINCLSYYNPNPLPIIKENKYQILGSLPNRFGYKIAEIQFPLKQENRVKYRQMAFETRISAPTCTVANKSDRCQMLSIRVDLDCGDEEILLDQMGLFCLNSFLI